MLRVQKLESLGTLAGGIAHDFNNLLTTILGNVTLAKNYLSPREKAFERMDAAAKAVERAQELTSQLLTFSRGGAPIKKTASIGELLRDSVVFALRGSKIRHVFSIPDDLWAVEMDEAQIHQVIHNLILNAVEAMPEGGTVRVKAENAELRGDHFVPLKDGHVRIAVHDSGEGIGKEILEKIFDPYFTTKDTGTGLGLATAYSVVKKHGGLMTVKSKVGVGSVFYFYLPAAKGKGRVGEVPSELPMSRKSRILVMDDDEMIRDLATELLFAMGLEAVSVQNGSEAVETYERELLLGRCFDAVIMDLTIPGGMGGKEALERLRTIDPSIKAIVSSGYSSDPIMSEYKKHGFMGVLAKPYQLSEFEALVEEILSEKKATIQDRP